MLVAVMRTATADVEIIRERRTSSPRFDLDVSTASEMAQRLDKTLKVRLYPAGDLPLFWTLQKVIYACEGSCTPAA